MLPLSVSRKMSLTGRFRMLGIDHQGENGGFLASKIRLILIESSSPLGRVSIREIPIYISSRSLRLVCFIQPKLGLGRDKIRPEALSPPNPAGSRRWAVVSLLFVASLINYLDRPSLSLALPVIGIDLHLD